MKRRSVQPGEFRTRAHRPCVRSLSKHGRAARRWSDSVLTLRRAQGRAEWAVSEQPVDGLWPQQGMKRRLCTAWRVPDPCSSPVRAELVEAWTGSAAMVEQRAHPSTSSGRAGTNSRSRRAEWDWPRRTGALEALTPSRNATKVAELSRGWSLLPAFPQGGHCQRTLTIRRRATIADERGGE